MLPSPVGKDPKATKEMQPMVRGFLLQPHPAELLLHSPFAQAN